MRPPLSWMSTPGGGWFRIAGFGLAWKDTRKHRPLFSERNGFRRSLMIGHWSITALVPK